MPNHPSCSSRASHPTGSHLVLLGLCVVLALLRGVTLMGEAHAATNDFTAQTAPEQTYQMALEARTERDYPAMLDLLREAGNAGDVRAQEMLASVLLAGPSLYGDAVASNLCEADLWARRAADQGSEAAKHQRAVLNGLRELSGGRGYCANTY